VEDDCLFLIWEEDCWTRRARNVLQSVSLPMRGRVSGTKADDVPSEDEMLVSSLMLEQLIFALLGWLEGCRRWKLKNV
jgi:hypothetical protein